MPELIRVGSHFDSVLKTTDGRHFTGRFAVVPEGNPTSVSTQKRFLRVRPGTFLQPGDMVFDHGGLRYLLAEGSNAMVGQDLSSRSFRCVLMDKLLPRTRRGKVQDPVTKLMVDAPRIPLGDIWCNVEPQAERLERSSKVASNYEKFKLYTAADLEVDDLVGDHQIIRVSRVAGITVADVE